MQSEGRICSTVNGDLLWSQFGGGSLSIGIYVQLVWPITKICLIQLVFPGVWLM